MQQICMHCKNSFEISREEEALYEKTQTELPQICFLCRLKQHFAFWSFGKFRKGVSDLSGKPLITTLPSSIQYPLYTKEEWYSDDWDPMSFGQKYDPERSFFEQFAELQKKVPKPHQTGGKSLNCDWCDDTWNSKNCYLSRSQEECEELRYSYRNIRCKNSVDLCFCFDMESSYDCTNCFHSYNLLSSFDSRDCVDSAFLIDCRNCTNCFMCWNLRGKSFCIENIEYSKEEYYAQVKKYINGTWSGYVKARERFNEIAKLNAVHREHFNIKTMESSGNYLTNANRCTNCYLMQDSEDCANVVRGFKDKTCIDANGCWYAELLGNCSCCVSGYAMKYSLWSNARFSEYLDQCEECEHCFGSISLRKKKYCILNIQYTKEEYEKLRDQIITNMKKNNEYGKFFPYSLATIPFNLSTAALFFPESNKAEIESFHGWWQEINEGEIQGKSTNDLPDSVHDLGIDISTEALICPISGWRFNVAADELVFYQQKNIPLPREHFDIRTKRRFEKLSAVVSEEYQCVFCGKQIQSYYPKSWGYKKIACQECYFKEIA